VYIKKCTYTEFQFDVLFLLHHTVYVIVNRRRKHNVTVGLDVTMIVICLNKSK